MAQLQLDYARRSRRIPVLGGVAIALGAAAALHAIVVYRALADEISTHEHRVASLAQSARPHAPRTGIEGRQMDAELRHAQRVLGQLTLPWDALLLALETATARKDKEIGVLSVQPDTEAAQLTVVGEAKDMSAMVHYLRVLDESEVFTNVYLLDHQVRQQDPQRPVRFSLVAGWEVSR